MGIKEHMRENKKKIPKIYNFRTAIWTPPKDTRVKLGEQTFMKMSKKVESVPTRTSAGTDGQEPSPTPVANMQGPKEGEKESTRKNDWAETSDEETSIEGETSGEQASPTLYDLKLKEGDDRLDAEENDNNQRIATIKMKKKDDEFLTLAGNSLNYNKEREKRENGKEKNKSETQKNEQQNETASNEENNGKAKRKAFNKRITKEFNEIFQGGTYAKYLSLTTRSKITPIELEDHLMRVYPSEEMSFRRHRESDLEWIIHTTSKNQSDRYLKIHKIKNTEVLVTTHNEMNSVWGTILLEEDEIGEEEEYFRILQGRNKLLEDMKLIVLKRREKKDVTIAKLKFRGENLPKHIYFGGKRKEIKAYVPKPTQCHHCSKFGHYKKFCNKQNPQCFYCSGSDHASKWKCGNPEKCINCGEDHHSRSEKCTVYSYYCKVKLLQERSGMSIKQAREQLAELGTYDPRRTNTIASILKNNTISTCNGNKTPPATTRTTSPKQDREKKEEGKGKQQEKNATTSTNNRFGILGETQLYDIAEGIEEIEMETSESQVDIMSVWDEPLPQRKTKERTRSPINKRSSDSNKRLLDESNSPTNESASSPKTQQVNKKVHHEESKANKDKQDKKEEEEVVFKIQSITTVRNTIRTNTEDHPLTETGEIEPQREDPEEGNRETRPEESTREKTTEKKKDPSLGEEQGKKKHAEVCGCNECFLEEATKYGKLDEKKVTELISTFIEKRNPETVGDELTHERPCCCVVHLKEKVEICKKKQKITKHIITTFKKKQN